MLQRAEYIFPALKNSLVSVFVFVWIEQNALNVCLQKILGGNFCHNIYISPHVFNLIAWSFYSFIIFYLENIVK
jgi:hypothetical protein